MKKLFLLLIILLYTNVCFGAAPTRTYTYTAGNTINPTEVTANEDNLFNWAATVVNLGANTVTSAYIVDGAVTSSDISDGTITNTDISASAAIVSTKITFPVNTCRAYRAAVQENLTDVTYTKVLLDTESFDVNNEFASNRFTAKTAGYYLISGSVCFLGSSIVVDKEYEAIIYKNNAAIAKGRTHSTNSVESLTANVFTLVNLAVNDYIELFAYVKTDANTVDIEGDTVLTYLEVQRLTN